MGFDFVWMNICLNSSLPLNPQKGKRQLFELGQYFRSRYNKLIGGKYSPEKVYIVSTDFDRAIMSAQTNLAGMFPPTEDEKWNDDIPWQPIPLHSIPEEMDTMLHGGRWCAKYEPLVNEIKNNTPEIHEIYKMYGHLFPYWASVSGMKIESIEDVADLHKKLNNDITDGIP